MQIWQITYSQILPVHVQAYELRIENNQLDIIITNMIDPFCLTTRYPSFSLRHLLNWLK